MDELRNLDELLRDILGDRESIEINSKLGILKPSKVLDVIRIRVGNRTLDPSMLEKEHLEEVVGFLVDQKKKKRRNDDPLENLSLPGFDDDGDEGDPDPLDDNPLIPDFD